MTSITEIELALEMGVLPRLQHQEYDVYYQGRYVATLEAPSKQQARYYFARLRGLANLNQVTAKPTL